jgi:hypothetical protein
MTSPVCNCGHTITDHPGPSAPTPLYLVARNALRIAVARAIYWPGISERHQAAIARARRERRIEAA